MRFGILYGLVSNFLKHRKILIDLQWLIRLEVKEATLFICVTVDLRLIIGRNYHEWQIELIAVETGTQLITGGDELKGLADILELCPFVLLSLDVI